MRKFTLKFTRILSLVMLSFVAGAGWLAAQNATISGTVLDENNEPMSGATIVLDGTAMGAMSDAEGKYSISGVKPGQYTLMVSGVSYEKFQQVITVTDGEKAMVDIPMKLKVLDDVIIVGYGTEHKRDMTGSVSKIGARELNDVPGASFDATLQGKAAGVQVIQSSGIAGAGAKITVRGSGSVSAGGDPLYVVDGIPITQDPFLNGDRGGQNNNPLSSINPADIESIEILKDAAAAAIYGSRGANGVILITTKRGKTGKPTFNLSMRSGLSRPAKLLDFVNTDQWLQMYQEAWENDGNVGQPTTLPGNYTMDSARANGTTDWQKLTTGTGIKQEYNLSMSQGTEKLKTYVDLSAMNNQSYLLGNSYRRYTGRVNLDWNILKNLKLGVSASGAYGRNNKVGQAWSGSLGMAQSNALPYFNEDTPNSAFGGGNPINRRTQIDWRTIEKRTINTLNLQYTPIKNLTLNANGSVDYMDLGDYNLEDSLWTNTFTIGKNWYNKILNWNSNATAKYDFNMLPKNHKLSAMVGAEAQKMTRKSGYYEVSDISEQLYQDWTGTTQSDTIDQTYPLDAWSFVSTFGRVNYQLNDRYILKASLRVDGSSKFGRNNRYGYFPAVGAAWVASEEEFWKNSIGKAVNFFKLKTSFGMTGNADIPSFLRFGTFSGTNNNIQYNGDSIIFPIRLENPNLKWETTQTIDAGFEFGMFKDRITGELAVYNKESRNVLLRTSSPSSSGFKEYWQNIGHIRNRGVELSITSFNINRGLKWKTTLNIARNRNLVVDVGTTPPDALSGSGDTRVVAGYPIGVNYLVRFSHVDPATGKPVYLDKNGNETFEWRTENRVVVGNVQPAAQGGLRNNFEWKGFDLNIFWTFTLGGKIYDDAAKRQYGVVGTWAMPNGMIDHWTHPGQVGAQYPRLTLDPATYGLDNEWNNNTTLWLYDASYARLKNVNFGYNFKITQEKKWFIQKLRIYASGTNLWTITKYPGSDPEIVRDQNGPQGRNISPNVTYLTPPQERTFSLGLDVQF